MNSNQVMPPSEAERFLVCLVNSKLNFWLDGGWGVDALVGKQTRQHKDLDICISIADQLQAKASLEEIGYSISKDESPTRLIMTDENNQRIDIHLLSFDEKGNGIQKYSGGFHKYPAKDLKCVGRISSLAVNCLSPQLQTEFRKIYTPNEKSLHDSSQLERLLG